MRGHALKLCWPASARRQTAAARAPGITCCSLSCWMEACSSCSCDMWRASSAATFSIPSFSTLSMPDVSLSSCAWTAFFSLQQACACEQQRRTQLKCGTKRASSWKQMHYWHRFMCMAGSRAVAASRGTHLSSCVRTFVERSTCSRSAFCDLANSSCSSWMVASYAMRCCARAYVSLCNHKQEGASRSQRPHRQREWSMGLQPAIAARH